MFFRSLAFFGLFESVLTTSMSRKGGLLYFSVFLKRVSLRNPRVSTKLCGFAFRKNQERASKFGSTLGRDRDSVNNCSAAAGRALNWTGRTLNSGQEKAHKHKQIFPVTARAGGWSPDLVGGGVSRPVARGQKFMCCVQNPRNINVFVRVPGREDSGSRPGGLGFPAGRIGDRGDRQIVYVPNV